MSDIGDAFGTAAEGGLFAKAVGGQTGALTDKAGNPLRQGHFAEGACLNCGTELVGEHCHACGQKAHLHRTIGGFVHDLLHGALHLDGKIWHTLPKLILKPGELTRRYVDGERAKFVSPMAMFLFSVFLMFAVFQAVGLTTPTSVNPTIEADGVVDETNDAVERVQGDAVARLEQARQQAAAYPEGTADRLQAEAEIAAAEELFNQMDERDKLEQGASALLERGKTGITRLDNILAKWRENPGLMLYKLQANAYKFSWLLIPLSAPFVSLLFAWKRRFKAYDHAIFVTYSLAFVSLLFITLSLLALLGIGGGWVFAGLAFIPPIHMYKHLKHTYGLRRFSTLWRLGLLLVFEFVVLLLFFQILLLLGAF